MKHLITISLSIIFLVWFGITSYGQTTNAFPPSGNVGIGTLSPSYKLQVVQDGWKARFSGSDGYIDIGTNTNYGMIYTDRSSLLFNKIITAHDGLFGAYSTSNFQFNTGVSYSSIGTTRMIITNGGNVGINTTSPSSWLTISGDINHTKTSLDVTGDVKLESGYLDFSRPSSTTTKARIAISSYAGAAGLRFLMSDDGSFTWPTHEFDALFLAPDGNVGMGTTQPTEKLCVKGRILAEGVDIYADVPGSDYVFNKDYKLRSLDNLEKYVTTNKHLPDVPSAKEFKKNGYSVGKMDDVLLRKVEELTLYVISLKKENEKLQAEINTIKN